MYDYSLVIQGFYNRTTSVSRSSNGTHILTQGGLPSSMKVTIKNFLYHLIPCPWVPLTHTLNTTRRPFYKEEKDAEYCRTVVDRTLGRYLLPEKTSVLPPSNPSTSLLSDTGPVGSHHCLDYPVTESLLRHDVCVPGSPLVWCLYSVIPRRNPLR